MSVSSAPVLEPSALPAKELLLVRDCRTHFNTQERLLGHLDPALDEVGRIQAAALAAEAASLRPDVVVSSPLLRARQTAEAIAVRAGADLVMDGRLIDRDYGRWAGLAQAEVIGHWGSIDRAPGIEPADLVTERALQALDAHSARLLGGAVIMVSHDAVNRGLLAALDPGLGAVEIPQDPGCWNLLLREDDQHWTVAMLNQVAGPHETAG